MAEENLNVKFFGGPHELCGKCEMCTKINKSVVWPVGDGKKNQGILFSETTDVYKYFSGISHCTSSVVEIHCLLVKQKIFQIYFTEKYEPQRKAITTKKNEQQAKGGNTKTADGKHTKV